MAPFRPARPRDFPAATQAIGALHRCRSRSPAAAAAVVSPRALGVLVLCASLGGCGALGGYRLAAPERFGLEPVAEDVYVEAGADESLKRAVVAAKARAEEVVRRAYGTVKSRPIIHACVTEPCYVLFGGMGSTAKVYGDRILLSPRGLNWHFIAHEWSHAEIRERLSAVAGWGLPAWFDEGLAVAISEAPEHSPAHWRLLVAQDIPRPDRSELLTYTSGRLWLDAVRRFGEADNLARRSRGEPERHPVYAAAGNEVRPWLATHGAAGLARLVERLNGGESFAAVYRSVDPAGSASTDRPMAPPGD